MIEAHFGYSMSGSETPNPTATPAPDHAAREAGALELAEFRNADYETMCKAIARLRAASATLRAALAAALRLLDEAAPYVDAYPPGLHPASHPDDCQPCQLPRQMRALADKLTQPEP